MSSEPLRRTQSSSERPLLAIIALIALFAVFLTHGLMADDAMHGDAAAECLATTADVSPARICAPPTTATPPRAQWPFTSTAVVPSAEQAPPEPRARARPGPSELQVFRI